MKHEPGFGIFCICSFCDGTGTIECIDTEADTLVLMECPDCFGDGRVEIDEMDDWL